MYSYPEQNRYGIIKSLIIISSYFVRVVLHPLSSELMIKIDIPHTHILHFHIVMNNNDY